VIYAGTRYSGIFKSTNGGVTWRRASKGLPFLPPCDQTFCPEEPVTALEIDPRDTRIVYAVFSSQVVKSVDAGKTWDLVVEGLEDASSVDTLVIDPESPNVLYVGTGEGVFKSTDGGATWRESSMGLPQPFADFAVVDLAIDVRGDQTVLYAATRMAGIFRSTDRGATWEPLNEGLPILLVDFVEIDGRRPGAVLAGTAGAGVWAAHFD
jgi:ligand-binding sensor domain-containing protein